MDHAAVRLGCNFRLCGYLCSKGDDHTEYVRISGIHTEEELQDYANSIFTYYILNLCAEMNKSKNLMISKLELELTFQKSKGKHSAAIYQELQDCRQKIQQLEADAEKMAERHQEQENAFKKEKDALTASYVSATAELRRKSKNLEEENENL